MKKRVTKKEVKELKKQSYKIKIYDSLILALFLYSFIFSIELIKKASLELAPSLKQILLSNLTPIEAVCAGWFATSIMQSSGAIGSIASAFAGNGIISLSSSVYILMGASIGATITAMIISLMIKSKKRRDFRHGFEIGLCYAIYVLILVGIVMVLELTLGIFTKISFFLASKISPSGNFLNVPDFINIITAPIIKILNLDFNNLTMFLAGIILLIITLNYIGKSIISVLGGEQKTRKFINKHFHSKYKSYFLGLILTAAVFSSGITIGLLVPLAVSRMINLKKTIPFIIGSKLGTGSDILLASIFIGKINALASAIAFLLFAVLGSLIFLPNTNVLFKITKYFSKRIMHTSWKKALITLLIFILLPLVILFIF